MNQKEIKAFTQCDEALLKKVIELSAKLPEFSEPYPLAEYQKRLAQRPHLLLLSYVEGQLSGFKLGYQLNESEFYSWLGGVHPDFRRFGLAKAMLLQQEQWARDSGYVRLSVKTRNRFAAMLMLLISQGYQLTGLESAADLSQNKLSLQKWLSDFNAF